MRMILLLISTLCIMATAQFQKPGAVRRRELHGAKGGSSKGKGKGSPSKGKDSPSKGKDKGSSKNSKDSPSKNPKGSSSQGKGKGSPSKSKANSKDSPAKGKGTGSPSKSKSKSKGSEDCEKVEWCHVQKKDLCLNDVDNHAEHYPHDYPATDGECISPSNVGILYDEGCPCFNQKDVAALLSLADGADDCSYYEFQYLQSTEWYLSASTYKDNVSTSRSVSLYEDIPSGTDSCSLGTSTYVSYTGSSLAYVTDSRYKNANLDGSFAGTTSDCQALIEDVKDKMKALGCEVRVPCEAGYFGPNCDLFLPNCTVPIPQWIGDGACDGEPYDTEECGYDGGDCCPPGYFGPTCELFLPNCTAPYPPAIGDGYCDGYDFGFNTKDCEFDGGDCPVPCDAGYVGPTCENFLPNCTVPVPQWIGDDICDGEPYYYTKECDFDGGDCEGFGIGPPPIQTPFKPNSMDTKYMSIGPNRATLPFGPISKTSPFEHHTKGYTANRVPSGRHLN